MVWLNTKTQTYQRYTTVRDDWTNPFKRQGVFTIVEQHSIQGIGQIGCGIREGTI
jgi:hypothetical protein